MQGLDEVSSSSFLLKNLAHLTAKPHFFPWPCKPSGTCRKLSPRLNFQPFSECTSISEWVLKRVKNGKAKADLSLSKGETGLRDCTEVFIPLINRIHSQRVNPGHFVIFYQNSTVLSSESSAHGLGDF